MWQLKAAQINLAYTEIRAPFAGRVGRNRAPAGTLINGAGAALNTIVQLDPVYVTFSPSETELAQIQQARGLGAVRTDITVPGATDLTRQGELTFIDNAVDYVKRCQDKSSGAFRYMVNSGITVPCTGTSILALEICGKDRHHSPEALKGGAFLLRQRLTWNQAHFFYSIYYCSQATFQLGDNYWNTYRPLLHELLDEMDGLGAGIDVVFLLTTNRPDLLESALAARPGREALR